MAESELDRIDPEPRTVKLSNGYEVGLQRLKTRQFFRLLRVLTRGLGPAMVQANLNFDGDQEAFGQRLLAMVLMAVPEAEQQFIEFLQAMTKPLGLIEADGRALDKKDREANSALLAEMLEELNNPELGDLITLAEEIVKQEAPDIQALGKRVASLLELARKTGQMDETKDQETDGTGSPELSPPPSISSPTSTDGATSTSSRSRSAGSASVSRRRAPADAASS